MDNPTYIQDFHVASNNDLTWDHIFTKQGIKVFKKDVAGSRFKAFRGTIEMDTSLSAFAALLLDADNMASWMHKTEEVRVIDQISENERIAYMAFDFTPLPKRDLVVRNRITQDSITKAVHYSMDFVSNHHELDRSGRGHLESLIGHVSAEPLAPGKIKITYQSHVEPGAKLLDLPLAGTITNKLLSDTPYQTLKRAKAMINKPQYRNAKFSFIEDH